MVISVQVTENLAVARGTLSALRAHLPKEKIDPLFSEWLAEISDALDKLSDAIFESYFDKELEHLQALNQERMRRVSAPTLKENAESLRRIWNAVNSMIEQSSATDQLWPARGVIERGVLHSVLAIVKKEMGS